MRESFDALSVECLMFQVAALHPCRLARFVLRDEQKNDANKTDSGCQAGQRNEPRESKNSSFSFFCLYCCCFLSSVFSLAAESDLSRLHPTVRHASARQMSSRTMVDMRADHENLVVSTIIHKSMSYLGA